MKDTIVVGLDGSQGSAHALHWLVTHVTGDQHVVAVHSIRPMGEFVLNLPVNGLGDWRKNPGLGARARLVQAVAGRRHLP